MGTRLSFFLNAGILVGVEVISSPVAGQHLLQYGWLVGGHRESCLLEGSDHHIFLDGQGSNPF